MELIDPFLAQQPRLAVVVITAFSSIDSAIEAIRLGAFDYLPKPFTPDQIRTTVERVARVRGLFDRVAELEERIRREVPEIDLEERDPAIARVLELARKVAPSDAAVLLRGESGTGKGVLARAIHQWSRRLWAVRDDLKPEPEP